MDNTNATPSITEDLLQQLKQKAQAAIDDNLQYSNEPMYDPRFGLTDIEQEFAEAASPVTILALIATIRAQAAELERIAVVRDNYCALLMDANADLERRKAGHVVPEDWKLVPVEPTPEMIAAAVNAFPCSQVDAYRAMLTAAPAAPAQVAQEPVAWMLDGTIYTELWAAEGYLLLSPGRSIIPLYTAPPAAEQPDTVKVRRELLEQAATWLEVHAPGGGCIEGSVADELRTLLAGGEA